MSRNLSSYTYATLASVTLVRRYRSPLYPQAQLSCAAALRCTRSCSRRPARSTHTSCSSWASSPINVTANTIPNESMHPPASPTMHVWKMHMMNVKSVRVYYNAYFLSWASKRACMRVWVQQNNNMSKSTQLKTSAQSWVHNTQQHAKAHPRNASKLLTFQSSDSTL